MAEKAAAAAAAEKRAEGMYDAVRTQTISELRQLLSVGQLAADEAARYKSPPEHCISPRIIKTTCPDTTPRLKTDQHF